MKFMVTWRVHPDKRHEVLKHWSTLTPQQRADAEPGVKIIGRWHNEAEFTGVAILETNAAAAMSLYLLQWNNVMDMAVAPVLDDEESAAVDSELRGPQQEVRRHTAWE
jgi:hypothetical protein